MSDAPAALTGFMIIDKPLGISSMQAVAAVRRRAGGKSVRVGHAGTLDPLATGVLVLALGRPATRIIDQVQALPKRYLTTIDLSAFTSTDDREGSLEPVRVSDPPSRDLIERTVSGQFIGEILQTPPAYSAVKVGGRRAYRMAREGARRGADDWPNLDVESQLQPRVIRIDAIEIVSYDWPLLTLDVRCGKGTYIRRLARDLGASLHTGGHCASLRRSAIGPFREEAATSLDALPAVIGQADLLSIDSVRGLIAAS